MADLGAGLFFFSHSFRLTPGLAAVENRDSETPLALFSHCR